MVIGGLFTATLLTFWWCSRRSTSAWFTPKDRCVGLKSCANELRVKLLECRHVSCVAKPRSSYGYGCSWRLLPDIDIG